MDESQYWKLIDASRRRAKGDPDLLVEALTSALGKLPAKEIVAFDRFFWRCLAKAYSWKLWAAAYTIKGGCSDDSFMYFRCWLVSRGQKVFESALADPDSLARVVDDDGDEYENECLMSVAVDAWGIQTGEDSGGYPAPDVPCPENPRGKKWTDEDLPKLVPKLWKKFGE